MTPFFVVFSTLDFKNGDTFAIFQGKKKSIKVRWVIRGPSTTIVIFAFDGERFTYTAEAKTGLTRCLSGSYYSAQAFQEALLRTTERRW